MKKTDYYQVTSHKVYFPDRFDGSNDVALPDIDPPDEYGQWELVSTTYGDGHLFCMWKKESL